MSLTRLSMASFVGWMLCLLLWNAVTAKEHPTEMAKRKLEFRGEKHLTVKMDIGAGTIDLERGRTGDLLDAEVEYDPEDTRVNVDYDRIGDEGRVYLKSEAKRKGIHLDNEDNYWRLGFGDSITISFEIDVGACDADFDFTGLKVDQLDMDLGASSVDVEFRKPNRERISEMKIDAGATKLKVSGLGNANFGNLAFDGGVGDFTLDFSGDFAHRAHADVEVGMGSLTILVPEDLGVRIRGESSFLSSISVDEHDFDEVEDDVYENHNFGRADGELTLDVEVGLGSVKVEYIDPLP
ncbi:MAG: toast rack family protein [Candidatus Zixiibacteriota bacterium]